MKHSFFNALTFALLTALAACSSDGLNNASTSLQGVAAIGGPLPGASVTVVDINGIKRSTKANAQGAYAEDVDGMTAPLPLSAIEAGRKRTAATTPRCAHAAWRRCWPPCTLVAALLSR